MGIRRKLGGETPRLRMEKTPKVRGFPGPKEVLTAPPAMATRTTKAGGKKTAPKKAAGASGKSGSRGAQKKKQAPEGILSSLIYAAVFLVLTAASCSAASLPSDGRISALAKEFPATTSLMESRKREAAREGVSLEVIHKPVPLERISPFLINALVASEDARFFKHEGVDWKEMEAAVKESAKTGRRLRGASTLTQQLAKNLFLSERRSPVRKLQELWITRKLEQHLSKDRLLAVYLNSVEWGDGVFGVEAASQVWFGKSASDVTLGEAAALVAMLPNPRRIGPGAYDEWHRRTARVLKRLLAEGKVTRQAAAKASEELERMVF